jgi:hypothetical protein
MNGTGGKHGRLAAKRIADAAVLQVVFANLLECFVQAILEIR